MANVCTRRNKHPKTVSGLDYSWRSHLYAVSKKVPVARLRSPTRRRDLHPNGLTYQLPQEPGGQMIVLWHPVGLEIAIKSKEQLKHMCRTNWHAKHDIEHLKRFSEPLPPGEILHEMEMPCRKFPLHYDRGSQYRTEYDWPKTYMQKFDDLIKAPRERELKTRDLRTKKQLNFLGITPSVIRRLPTQVSRPDLSEDDKLNLLWQAKLSLDDDERRQPPPDDDERRYSGSTCEIPTHQSRSCKLPTALPSVHRSSSSLSSSPIGFKRPALAISSITWKPNHVRPTHSQPYGYP